MLGVVMSCAANPTTEVINKPNDQASNTWSRALRGRPRLKADTTLKTMG